MSGNATIDQRVVEMEFNNKNFENNVGTSLNTIDKLKKSLNFDKAQHSFAGLSKAAAGFSLNSIANGVEALQSRFSTLGIMGITILTNLTNAAYNAGLRIANALTIAPIKLGFDEYETQMNAIQTILSNTQKEGTTLDIVSKALDELNTYADKTIYNFTQMTKNIGTFTAAGIKLDTSVAAIKGIANLAAVSGSNADQASMAMYQLSQALSSGTVRLMDWNSVVNAGMGGQIFQDSLKETARVHGVAIDDIISKEGSFRDSLQTGWLTSQILTETLAKFTGDLTREQLKALGYTEEQITGIVKLGQMSSDAATKVKTFTQLFDTLREAAQSGWAKTWQIVIGDFYEARDLMTEISDVVGGLIGSSADVRNEVLESWKAMGGRTDIINALRNTFKAFFDILKPISEALREIFPPVTAKQLKELSSNILELTEKFKMGEKTVTDIKRIFKGLFALLDIGRLAFDAIGKALFGFISTLGPFSSELLNALGNIGDFIVKLRDSIIKTDAFNTALSRIVEIIRPAIDFIKRFFDSFKLGFKSFGKFDTGPIETFIDKLKIRISPLTKMWEAVGRLLKGFGKVIEKLAPVFGRLATIVADGFAAFMDGITKNINNFDPQGAFDFINGGLLAGLLLAIKKFVDKGSGALDGITGILDGVKNSLQTWQNSLKADMLLKIAASLGILALSLLILASIDGDKLAASLTAMGVMFGQLILAMSAFEKISSGINFGSISTMTIGLIGIATAILILSTAMSKLGKMEGGDLVKGLLSIGVMSTMLIVIANQLSKSSPKIISGSFAMVIFAGALMLMTKVVKDLAAINSRSLISGLVGIGVLLAEIAGFMQVTNIGSMGMKSAIGLVILAGALNIMAYAVNQFAKIDSNKMAQGLIGIGVVLTELTLFMKLTNNSTSILTTAVSLTILSVALVILAKALTTMGAMSWEEIARGMTAMGGSLLIIGAAMTLLPKDMLLSAISLTIISGALMMLASALTTMGSMSWEQMGTGLAGLAGSLIILAVGLSAMTTSMAGSAALLVAAAALMILAPALKLLGSMSLEEIGLSLLAIAGVLAVLGIAGAVMTPVIPTILALAGALFLFGIAAAAVGIGVLAFSAGLAMLAVSGTAGAAALVVIITSLVGLLPMIAQQLGKAIITIITVIGEGAPAIVDALVKIGVGLAEGLVELIPIVVDAILVLIESILVKIAEKTPTLVQAGYDIIKGFLTGVKNNIGEVIMLAYDIVIEFINAISVKLPELIDAGFKFIISLIDGISAAIEQNLPQVMAAGQRLGMSIIKGILGGWIAGSAEIRQGMWDIAMMALNAIKQALGINSPSTAFIEIGLQMVAGLIKGLFNGAVQLITMVGTLVQNLVTAFSSRFSAMITIGGVLIESFKKGMTTKTYILLSTATSMINSFVNQITSRYYALRDAGANIISGFIKGIKDNIYLAVRQAYNLADAVLNTIKDVLNISSPSKELYDIAVFVVRGFANGIVNTMSMVNEAISTLGDSTLDDFYFISERINNALNAEINTTPVITPVIDLDAVAKGGKAISGLITGKASLNLGKSLKKVSTINTPAAATGGNIENTQGNMGGSIAQPTVQYVQNIYSPTAVDRVQIYRETRNQLNRTKSTGVGKLGGQVVK